MLCQILIPFFGPFIMEMRFKVLKDKKNGARCLDTTNGGHLFAAGSSG